MTTTSVTARFDTAEQLDAALFELRRSGAVCHTGALSPPYLSPPTLHVAVRPENAVLTRAILRRSGGAIIP
ncbi:MAG: hypothetical protein IJH47_03330 [Oscillospiraceae bacterium]|nr:hypothetical protein [Oscillospiraceae bacterium]